MTCTTKITVFSVSPTWRDLRVAALRMGMGNEGTLHLEAAVVNWHASRRRRAEGQNRQKT